MKSKQRKRKFVVGLSANDSDRSSEDNRTASNPKMTETDVLDMRITTHGKISLYAGHIISELGKNSNKTVYLYAEGAAIAKLVTVLEIVKRNSPCSGSPVSSELSIGNTASSPCNRTTQNTRSNDAAETKKQSSSGLYDLKIIPKKIENSAMPALQNKPSTKATNENANANSNPNEQPWLLAKLWVAQSNRM